MLIPSPVPNFPSYEIVLNSFGMSSDCIPRAMQWAFGDGWSNMLIVDCLDKFNQLHPGLYTHIDSNYIILLETIYKNFQCQ